MGRTRMVTSMLRLVLVVALIASACGGGDDDAADPPDTEARTSETSDTPDADDDDDDDDAPDDSDDAPDDEQIALGPEGEIDLASLDSRIEGAMPYTEILELTIEDLEAFWGAALPEVYGIDYTQIPEDEWYPYDADTDPPGCPDPMAYEDMAGNAFYCSLGDFVAWDQGSLFPELYAEFGPFALAMVLAHEWGHAIQDQTGTEGPTIMMEQQADCFAGAWTGYLASGSSELLMLDPGDLELALAGMLRFRDEPGTAVEDPSAHGSGFDRIAAFQEGYTQGPGRCAAYPDDPPILAPLEFATEEEYTSGGNLPLADTLDATSQDLNDYWVTLLGDAFIPVDSVVPYTAADGPPTCGGTEVDPDFAAFNIFFCVDENYVAWDEELVAVVHAEIGDFGVAALLSAQWATSAQVQSGYTEETTATALQRDCFAGSWTGNVYNFTVAGPEAAGREPYFSLSPGDLDEVIQAFIAFSVAAGSEEAELYGSAFDRVGAFREGFLDGAETCIAYTEPVG